MVWARRSDENGFRGGDGNEEEKECVYRHFLMLFSGVVRELVVDAVWSLKKILNYAPAPPASAASPTPSARAPASTAAQWGCPSR